MWVRAVAAALAVWCVSEAAMAAGYSEVWNPPEATRPAAKSAKKKVGAGKVTAGGKAKAGAKHVAAATRKTSPRVASAGGAAVGVTAHGGKPATHGGVKKVAVKDTAKSTSMSAAKGKAKMKGVVTAQAKKPYVPHASHAPLAQAKPVQGKIVHANLIQSRSARAHTVQVAAKPAVPHGNASAMSANVGAAQLDAATNPATASSGSLPPILH
jgi:hypothetical protein